MAPPCDEIRGSLASSSCCRRVLCLWWSARLWFGGASVQEFSWAVLDLRGGVFFLDLRSVRALSPTFLPMVVVMDWPTVPGKEYRPGTGFQLPVLPDGHLCGSQSMDVDGVCRLDMMCSPSFCCCGEEEEMVHSGCVVVIEDDALCNRDPAGICCNFLFYRGVCSG